jgi:DUF1680 family protein
MEIRTVETDPQVKDNIGKFAIEYGPLVYCMEEADNPAWISLAPSLKSSTVEWQPNLLGGVNVIRGKAAEGDYLLIPYYIWSNRGTGRMKVFF